MFKIGLGGKDIKLCLMVKIINVIMYLLNTLFFLNGKYRGYFSLSLSLVNVGGVV